MRAAHWVTVRRAVGSRPEREVRGRAGVRSEWREGALKRVGDEEVTHGPPPVSQV